MYIYLLDSRIFSTNKYALNLLDLRYSGSSSRPHVAVGAHRAMNYPGSPNSLMLGGVLMSVWQFYVFLTQFWHV